LFRRTAYELRLSELSVPIFFKGITDLFYLTNALQPPIVRRFGECFWTFVVSMVAPKLRTSQDLEFFLSPTVRNPLSSSLFWL